MTPDDELTPEKVALYLSMTPQERWKTANKMYWDARHAKAAKIRGQHPDWTGKQVNAEVGRIFLAEAMKEG